MKPIYCTCRWTYNNVSHADILMTEATTNLLYKSVKDPQILTDLLSANLRAISHKGFQKALRFVDSAARGLIDPRKCGDEYESIADYAADAMKFLVSGVVVGDFVFKRGRVEA